MRDATNNAGMLCLRTGSPSDCRGVAAANALTRFYLWSDVTTTVTPYVNVDPSGLKLDGNTCSPYGAASNACPIRVKLCWQAVDVKSPPPANIAGDGPNGTDCGIDTDATQIDCTVANGSQDCKIRIRGTFEYQATGQGLGFGARLKSENYTVNFTRGSADKAQYVHVTDRKVKNTPGGGCTAGAWNNRVFNTLVADTGGNVVGFTNGSDQTSITLKAGTYQCEVSAPSGTTTEHQARLVVGGAPTLSGSSGYYYSPSNIAGNFTITANTAISVQQIFQATGSPVSNCMGKATNFGAAGELTEVYTSLRCLKVTN